MRKEKQIISWGVQTILLLATTAVLYVTKKDCGAFSCAFVCLGIAAGLHYRGKQERTVADSMQKARRLAGAISFRNTASHTLNNIITGAIAVGDDCGKAITSCM